MDKEWSSANEFFAFGWVKFKAESWSYAEEYWHKDVNFIRKNKVFIIL